MIRNLVCRILQFVLLLSILTMFICAVVLIIYFMWLSVDVIIQFFGYTRKYYLFDKPEKMLCRQTDMTNILFIQTTVHLKKVVYAKGWSYLFWYFFRY